MRNRLISVLLILSLLLAALPVGILASEQNSDSDLNAELLAQVQAMIEAEGLTEEEAWYDEMLTEEQAAAMAVTASDSAAAEVTDSYSTAYPNTWKNTGNQAYDIAQIALTQVGYEETGDNHTKYNAWFYGSDTAVAWCAVFISWCADQAGIPTSVIRKNAMASAYGGSSMQNNPFGAPAYAFGAQTPQAGDIIFVTSGGSTSNHVGLVVSVDDKYIYTVEGNVSDTCGARMYTRSTGYQAYGANSVSSSIRILFIARPNYTGSGISTSGGSNTQTEDEDEDEDDGVVVVPDPVAGFVDVSQREYFAEPVAWAVENGITNGMTETSFAPYAACTRGQIVTFLWRYAGKPSQNVRCPFTDVSSSQYYYDPVRWAVSAGVTTGTTPTTFSPDAGCTRAQAVTFLWRAAGSPEPAGTSCDFTDLDTDSYYYKAVLWAVENGITNGTTPTTFSPNNVCTRGQIVTFLYRAAN